MNWTTVRQRMRRRREALGWSQDEAAFHCGVGPNCVGWWERGRTSPSAPNFLKWCEGLRVSPAAMLAEDPPPDAL